VEDNVCNVVVTGNDRTFRLVLPFDLGQAARISIESTDGETVLPRRRLPAGVMPYGPEGSRLVERWDSRYRGDSRPGWDKGFPSSHLKAAVEGGGIKPGRAVVLGCGTGTNAIYLAEQGFDVTAIDIAPTALNLAQEKAEKADVKVRWLLADVLAPPTDLEPFDFIFDRGCYHGVRRNNAKGYVKTLKRLSRPGTQVLILAGNANEERHYGPPRVKEEELRGDFSSAFDFARLDTVRFDSADPDQQGALAWSILLRRKAEEEP
jgi:SAM-dependent methyltransferase